MYERALINGLLCVLIAAVLVLIAAENSQEIGGRNLKDVNPSATINVASEQTHLIMGGAAGKGVMHFNGKEYPFIFRSASGGLGDTVIKKINASGKVYFLTRIEDFAGQYTQYTQYTYTPVAQTIMAGATATTAIYRNGKGVSIDLRGTVEGMGLSVGDGIATVELVRQ